MDGVGGGSMSAQPVSGTVTVQRGRVVWTMEPDEARDLADFIHESISSGDIADRDVQALREAADAADGGEATA
jgi:hypothetical protein